VTFLNFNFQYELFSKIGVGAKSRVSFLLVFMFILGVPRQEQAGSIKLRLQANTETL
jgi:hypothetical protein